MISREFGDRVRTAREHAGLSREELAVRAGCSAGTVKSYELSDEAPKWSKTLAGLERALGVQLVDRESFGDRLRTAREAAGFTREQLAARVHSDTTTIRNYEKRPTPPRRRDKIPGLEHALGVRLIDRDGQASTADLDPRASDAATLGRALMARIELDARDRAHETEEHARTEAGFVDARQAALPLVAKLAAGSWVDEEQRDAWRAQVEHALTVTLLPVDDDDQWEIAGVPSLEDRPDDDAAPGDDSAQA